MIEQQTLEMADADDLRKLAAWYREFAERAGNPTIWAARLRTAEEMEAEAERIEARRPVRSRVDGDVAGYHRRNNVG